MADDYADLRQRLAALSERERHHRRHHEKRHHHSGDMPDDALPLMQNDPSWWPLETNEAPNNDEETAEAPRRDRRGATSEFISTRSGSTPPHHPQHLYDELEAVGGDRHDPTCHRCHRRRGTGAPVPKTPPQCTWRSDRGVDSKEHGKRHRRRE